MNKLFSILKRQILPDSTEQNIKSVFFKPSVQLTPAFNNNQKPMESDTLVGKSPSANEAIYQPFFRPAAQVQPKFSCCKDEGEIIGIDKLNVAGQKLPGETRNFYEKRFGYDFSNVKVHTDAEAAKSAKSVNALAFTFGNDIVFNTGQYSLNSDSGKRLLGHELTHAVQQQNSHLKKIQRREAPYITKVTVHLTPPQSADLEWQGTPPEEATGSDHFTVSTGKGYSNREDPAGTCTRSCCTDALTQCAPPWNQPERVGACCTYYGNNFWTGIPLVEHNGWKWWTPIQPFYSSRGIALHQHDEVTGQPIGHGCVRMEEPNAKRIFDYSNRRLTNVTVDGRAAPVECNENERCAAAPTGQLDQPVSIEDAEFAANNNQVTEPIEGLEGLMT
jgi:hypothetical protein